MYNDNLLLTTQPHDATYGYWVSPAAEFTAKTERLSVSSQTKVSFASYYGGDEFNFTNYFLPLAVQYKTEKDILGFTGGYVRDNTLLGELVETGIVTRFTQRINGLPIRPGPDNSLRSCRSNQDFSSTTPAMRMFRVPTYVTTNSMVDQAGYSIR